LRIRTLTLVTVLALSIAAARILAGTPPKPAREMAVTFDDLPGVVAPGEGTAELRALTEKLVRAIASARIPAVGFVNEGKLAPAGSRDLERVALLGRWVSAGLELGNHTYSHLDLHRVRLFSREIRQILLVHANILNADRFSELAARLRDRGYAFCSLGRALEEPAYGSADAFTGAGGISWLHRWALTSGGREVILPGEPATPRFVMDAAGVSEE
jgi:peptidoglycan/xylan/chitin deacetylase (PgdA/CDA1 family)